MKSHRKLSKIVADMVKIVKFLVQIISEHLLKVIFLMFETETVVPCLVWKLKWGCHGSPGPLLEMFSYSRKKLYRVVYFISSHEYKTNTGSIECYYNQLLVTYGIATNENGLAKTRKAKWKKIVKSKISHQENQCYKTESSKLSKLQEINKRKKVREKYVTQFKRSEVSLLIKARSRMLNLKNNFKGQFKGDVFMPTM